MNINQEFSDRFWTKCAMEVNLKTPQNWSARVWDVFRPDQALKCCLWP